MARGGRPARWWVAPESADGLRAKAGRNPGATRADSDAEISPDLSLPSSPRFSIGLLRRNRHLASPADDSDRRPPATRSVPSGLSAITSASSSVCEAYVVVRSTPPQSWPFRCNMQRERDEELEAAAMMADARGELARQQKS